MWFFKRSQPDDPLLLLNNSLQKLCRHINAGSGNYSASMQIYLAPQMAGKSLAESVSAALGTPCQIQWQAVSSMDELINEFQTATTYKGDDTSYPSSYAATTEGENFIQEITTQLRSMFAPSESIFEITINEGHPFYPVFWDFAFLIELLPDAYLFVASSSD